HAFATEAGPLQAAQRRLVSRVCVGLHAMQSERSKRMRKDNAQRLAGESPSPVRAGKKEPDRRTAMRRLEFECQASDRGLATDRDAEHAIVSGRGRGVGL